MSNLIPIRIAADLLGVSQKTLRDWDDSGKLKSIRPGGNKGHRRYDAAALKKIIEQEARYDFYKENSDDLARWKSEGYIDDNTSIPGALALILTNMSLYMSQWRDKIVSEQIMLMLVKETWSKIKYKQFFSVQPMMSPTVNIYSINHEGMFVAEPESFTATILAFSTPDWLPLTEDTVDLYAEYLAKEIDQYLLKTLLTSCEISAAQLKNTKPDLIFTSKYGLKVLDSFITRNGNETIIIDESLSKKVVLSSKPYFSDKTTMAWGAWYAPYVLFVPGERNVFSSAQGLKFFSRGASGLTTNSGYRTFSFEQ